MSIVISLVVGILVVLAITALTGYFVAQEFAYMAVDRNRLQSRAAQGDDTARRTLGITRRTSFLLSGAQLGITMTGLLVGYVAEPLIGMSISTVIGGDPPTGVAVAIGGIVALTFSTLVQMLFGELFPKNYAIARSDQVSGWLSRSTAIYLAIFKPLIWVFDKAAELLLRALGIEPVHDLEHAATVRDLEHVLEESRESGDLDPELSTMLDRILDFPQRDVEHAMIPRARVDVLRDTTTIDDARAEMSTGHTRYPVLDEDDRIVGVAHLIDVLAVAPGSAEFAGPVSGRMRPALVLSHLMALPHALQEMDDRSEQLACVVDEYGGFAGVLTIEDMAEEIVGEITDEHDPEDPDYVPQPDDGVWVVSGDIHVDEIERALLVDLPRGEYETIAGLVIDAYGALPPEGTVVEVELPLDPGDYVHDDEPAQRFVRAEVLDVDNHVPSRLRLTLPEPVRRSDRERGDDDADRADADREGDAGDLTGRGDGRERDDTPTIIRLTTDEDSGLTAERVTDERREERR